MVQEKMQNEFANVLLQGGQSGGQIQTVIYCNNTPRRDVFFGNSASQTFSGGGWSA
jgi:hypothetical protein